MIGIVAVSHSARLAEAARELALQMVPADAVALRLAAGAGSDAGGEPILGTDAMLVATAIDELAAGCDGVLVLMDLGSAVMSAELALELRTSDVPVRLTPAPFVEGLLAAAVSAAAGGALDDVTREATAALEAKRGQLDDGADASAPDADAGATPSVVRTVTVRNALGVHARPAALIAETARGAEVRLRRLPDGPDAATSSLSRLLALGATAGEEVELRGFGHDAEAAVARLAGLFEDGFGEELAGAVPPRKPAGAATRASGSARTEPDAVHPGTGADPGRDATPTPEPVASGGVLRGRGVSPGRAAAPVVALASPVPEPSAGEGVPPDARDAEAARIGSAAAAVAGRFNERAAAATGETRAILQAAGVLAADPELLGGATERVRTGGTAAARAVWETAAEHERDLLAVGGRTAERAADLRDVRDRIVAELLGLAVPGMPERDEPFVLVAVDLAPSETAALEGSACVALVTEQGGPTSHTAIIARALGLPAAIGVSGATGIPIGATVLVDGEVGTVTVDPPEDAVTALATETEAPAFDGAGRLADGAPVPLLANVGGASDAAAAASAGAEGVGLFRTEFCFLGRRSAPSVDGQVVAYRGVLASFAGRRVIVRTLDAGSDKPLPFAGSAREENPALGVRGLRVSWREPALLEDQLRALAAAAAVEGAQVEVMAPMVATIDEARSFAAACRAAGLDRVGVMVETPAAALMAGDLLRVVDFVSIGTNDLAQYTMAADRLHPELGALNDPWQPAVLRLIGAVGAAGRAAGAPVGICGEAGGDPLLAPVLVGLGATSLSMTPRALGRVAQALAAVGGDDCRRAADAVLAATTADQAREAADAALRR